MKLPKYISKEQYKHLYDQMPTPMMKDALTVMYVLGLRISELCKLDKSHVDLVNSIVTVYGKGGTVYNMPIKSANNDLTDIFARAVRRPGKLFGVKVRSFRNYVYLAASRAKIGHVHPHMVRHSRATHLLNDGRQLADIGAVLRHASPTSTLIYTHVAVDRMRTFM